MFDLRRPTHTQFVSVPSGGDERDRIQQRTFAFLVSGDLVDLTPFNNHIPTNARYAEWALNAAGFDNDAAAFSITHDLWQDEEAFAASRDPLISSMHEPERLVGQQLGRDLPMGGVTREQTTVGGDFVEGFEPGDVVDVTTREGTARHRVVSVAPNSMTVAYAPLDDDPSEEGDISQAMDDGITMTFRGVPEGFRVITAGWTSRSISEATVLVIVSDAHGTLVTQQVDQVYSSSLLVLMQGQGRWASAGEMNQDVRTREYVFVDPVRGLSTRLPYEVLEGDDGAARELDQTFGLDPYVNSFSSVRFPPGQRAARAPQFRTTVEENRTMRSDELGRSPEVTAPPKVLTGVRALDLGE